MRLLILGGGNMGGSILHSLEKIKDISPKNILLIEKDEQKRINLSKASGCLSQTKIDKNTLNLAKIDRISLYLVELDQNFLKLAEIDQN